jgi:cell division transport system permease protein
MRRLSALAYFLRQAWRQLVRDRPLTSTAVLANTATLFVSALFLLIAYNLDLAVRSIRAQREVQVFLDRDLDPGRWEPIGEALAAIEGVASATFVSPDEAIEEFERDFGESGLTDALGENPLPAAYRLELLDGYGRSEAIAAVSESASRIDGVEEVHYGGPGLAKVEAKVRAFALLNLVVGLLTALSAILIVANTIRLTIIARMELVEILKLIGATDGFVRWPFLLEGGLQCFVAGVLALAALWGVYAIVASRIAGVLYFSTTPLLMFLTFALMLGGAGAHFATREPLRQHWRKT